MDINILREIVTVASFVAFVGIVLWAWSGANRERFAEAAQLPFDDGAAQLPFDDDAARRPFDHETAAPTQGGREAR